MSFEVAAETYDGFMGRYSRLLSGQLADLASVSDGQRVKAGAPLVVKGIAWDSGFGIR